MAKYTVESWNVMEVDQLADDDGHAIKKGTKVLLKGEKQTGIVTCLYHNNTVDIHHADSHQGHVIDSYHVIDHGIKVLAPSQYQCQKYKSWTNYNRGF